MQKIGIIGGGRMAGIFAKNAREMGIESYCFSPRSGIVEENLFDHICEVNILELDNLLVECQKAKIDGVVSTTELTIAPTAYVAEKMNLVGITYENALEITNKYRNREKTIDVKDLHHPKFSKVFSVEEIKNLDYEYPIILKPTSKGGKRGITVINNKNEIEPAFEYAMKEANGELPFIVEEFIVGEMECSVESLTCNDKTYVIQVTEKITSGAPHCVELAHHQPANISRELKSKIEKVISDSLHKIGLTNGACHTEIKIKNDEIYLIEFNARPGGDHIAYPLTELSTGYPYIKGAIKIALATFSENPYLNMKPKYAGVVFITEQTKEYKKVFDNCENKKWLYKKNLVSEGLSSITHNDGFNKNYFIYCADEKPNFEIGEN